MQKNDQCNIAERFSAQIGIEAIQQWGKNIERHLTSTYEDSELAIAQFLAQHYLEQTVILPTVSPIIRVGFAAIYNYFSDFLSRNPRLILTEEDINTVKVTLQSDGCGVMCGYYGFLIQGQVLSARYCMQFQYLKQELTAIIPVAGRAITVKQGPGWYIMMKHSSWCPAIE